jgi:hypothetical protein
MVSNEYIAQLFANASVKTSSRYFEAGVYHIKIDGAKIFSNRQGRPRASVDCTVVGSNNPSFPPTSQVSWVVSLDNDSGPSSIVTFIHDVTGCSPQEASSAQVLNKFFPNIAANPNAAPSIAIGLHALVHAFEKPTKSGGIYTKCSWKKFDPAQDEAPDFAAMPQVESVDKEIEEPESESGDPIPF